jgi:two-component system phosphate regulon sensor histidine kinase PhoR
VTFRSKIFLTALTASAFAVAAATTLVSASVRRNMERRIEQDVAGTARMAAEILAHRTAASDAELDAEADALGRILSARVTFIAADGRVVGDSELTPQEVKAVENHSTRPEIVDAKRDGIGSARRHSATIGTDMMYVAIPVSNPAMPALAIIRLAVPLTDVDRQLVWVRTLSLLGFGTGIATALLLTWGFSVPLTRRLQSMQQRVEQYGTGDLSQLAPDYTDDEVGTIARLLDRLARDFSVRLSGLEADRARMEAILAGMIEGVLVVNEHGRLQLANEAARRMLRIDEAVGRHYPEIVRQPAVARQIANALAGKPTESVELTELRESAAILIARTAPVEVARGRGAVVVLHDITDLRRADQIRRDFVANVSHELRTPLTAVRGYVEALADADPEESRRFLEIVSRHTMRMERLVRDLLRLARLDAGQELLERVPCSIESLFTAVESDLAPLIEARRQSVERTVDQDAATVTGDPAKLQDALRNLLENAINYSPEESTIRMRAQRRGGRIVMTVADEGPGIPEADLPRVFERFYRVDKSRTRDGRDPGGTGLGLAIVKHLVELHGGKVTAANKPPRGALLTIELPA